MAVPSASRSKLLCRTQPLLVAIAVSGCGLLQPSLPKRELAGGGTVGSLVAGADTAVVLLYAPSDCFACYGGLQPWLEWRRQHPGRVAVVFSRPPTPTERTELATYRIHADGVLRRRLVDRVRRLETPTELLLVGGRVAAHERMRSKTLTTPFYRRLAQGREPADAAPPPGNTALRREP